MVRSHQKTSNLDVVIGDQIDDLFDHVPEAVSFRHSQPVEVAGELIIVEVQVHEEDARHAYIQPLQRVSRRIQSQLCKPEVQHELLVTLLNQAINNINLEHHPMIYA